MRAVRAFYSRRAKRLHELFHVMREFVYGVHVIVHDPDIFVRIILIDRNKMGPLEKVIVLRKCFSDISFGVHDRQTVFPLRVYANGSLPKFWTIIGILARAACSRQRCNRSVAPRQPSDGIRKTRSKIRELLGRRSLYV